MEAVPTNAASGRLSRPPAMGLGARLAPAIRGGSGVGAGGGDTKCRFEVATRVHITYADDPVVAQRPPPPPQPDARRKYSADDGIEANNISQQIALLSNQRAHTRHTAMSDASTIGATPTARRGRVRGRDEDSGVPHDLLCSVCLDAPEAGAHTRSLRSST